MNPGSEVRVILDNTTIIYADGTSRRLRHGAPAGAFSDFVAGGPDGGEGVEIFVNHPDTGEPMTAVVSANRVTIAGVS